MNGYRFLIRIQYAWLNALVSLIRMSLFSNIHKDAASVLVVRKGNLGDMVCSFPAFEAIQKYFPNAAIDLLTTHGVQSSLGASSVIPQDYFREVYEYRLFSVKALFSLIQQQKYDVVIELPPDVDTVFNQVRNMIFFRLAGIQNGGGWSVTRTSFLRKQQLKQLQFATEQERLQEILRECGIPAGVDEYPALYTERDLRTAHGLFKEGVPEKLAAIGVGAKLDKKKWPLNYVKEVVNFLTDNGYTLVAVGDESDAESIRSMDIPAVYNVCGKLNIAESAALLSMCKLMVCNDSGPMHLSYAVGIPVYAIFSARNYRGKWNPPANGKNKVFADYTVPCAGCMNTPCSDNICMKQITPQQVISSIQLNL